MDDIVLAEEYIPGSLLTKKPVISTYINTKMSVCLFVYLFTFFSAISKPIGKPFGTNLPFAPGSVLK